MQMKEICPHREWAAEEAAFSWCALAESWEKGCCGLWTPLCSIHLWTTALSNWLQVSVYCMKCRFSVEQKGLTLAAAPNPKPIQEFTADLHHIIMWNRGTTPAEGFLYPVCRHKGVSWFEVATFLKYGYTPNLRWHRLNWTIKPWKERRGEPMRDTNHTDSI